MHPLTRRALADVTTPTRQEPPAAAVAPCASTASAFRACHARLHATCIQIHATPRASPRPSANHTRPPPNHCSHPARLPTCTPPPPTNHRHSTHAQFLRPPASPLRLLASCKLVPLVRGYSARKNTSSTSTWPTEYKRLHLTASSPTPLTPVLCTLLFTLVRLPQAEPLQASQSRSPPLVSTRGGGSFRFFSCYHLFVPARAAVTSGTYDTPCQRGVTDGTSWFATSKSVQLCRLEHTLPTLSCTSDQGTHG
ncbi:hypothetical protein COCVIDRAFT_98272 [Bipolaris victoriae FI3]|uniref:Uncharacterized protein n=1 Tax=Bipolaris victoriae (strain FI3) TaxID=930091 RepID=W7EGF5_BIPV3|nr:hypothetical protein COCVIDRAFT_98272 [Bipolaris victoriae FI3]